MSLKKTVATIFYKLTDFVYYFVPNKSRVIIYHHLDKSSTEYFEKNIQFLRRKGYKFVDAHSFAKLLFESKHKLKKEKICAITFDDGFDSLINYAYPILEKYNITATVFVNLKLHEIVGDKTETRAFTKLVFPRIQNVYNDLKGLSLEELNLLVSNNIEIGGHTYSHPNLGIEVDYEKEFVIPKIYFEQNLNISLKTFAYPYGRKRNYNKDVMGNLKKHGYDYAFLGISKNPLKFKSSIYEIPRTSIPVNCNNFRLNALMSGSQDLFDYLLNENREI